MGKPVLSMPLGYDEGLDPGFIHIPNGDVVPLPPRSMWPGPADGSATLYEEDEKKYYYVTLIRAAHQGTTTTSDLTDWLEKKGPGKVAQSLARSTGVKIVGGIAGAIIGGIATLLVPSPIAKQSEWRTTISNGTPVVVVMIGF